MTSALGDLHIRIPEKEMSRAIQAAVMEYALTVEGGDGLKVESLLFPGKNGGRYQ